MEAPSQVAPNEPPSPPWKSNGTVASDRRSFLDDLLLPTAVHAATTTAVRSFDPVPGPCITTPTIATTPPTVDAIAVPTGRDDLADDDHDRDRIEFCDRSKTR